LIQFLLKFTKHHIVQRFYSSISTNTRQAVSTFMCWLIWNTPVVPH